MLRNDLFRVVSLSSLYLFSSGSFERTIRLASPSQVANASVSFRVRDESGHAVWISRESSRPMLCNQLRQADVLMSLGTRFRTQLGRLG